MHWQLQMDHNRQVHILPRNNPAPGHSSHAPAPGHHGEQHHGQEPGHHHPAHPAQAEQAVNMAQQQPGAVKVKTADIYDIYYTYSISIIYCQGSLYEMSVGGHAHSHAHLQHPGPGPGNVSQNSS